MMGLVAAVGSAVIGIAADVGVAVTATALTVGFGTIAAVGAGLSAIGAVTGDKALSYVGAGLGLVGGIGSLASAAGVIGADAASGGSSIFSSTAADAAGSGADAATTSATAAAAGSTSGDVVDSLAGNAGLQTLSDANPLTGAADLAGGQAAATGADAGSTAAQMFTPPPGNNPDFVSLNATNQPAAAPAAAANEGDSLGQDQVAAQPTTGTPTTTPNPATLSQQPAPPALTAGADNSTGAININGVPAASVGDNTTVNNLGITGAPATGSSTGVFDSLLGFVDQHPSLAFGAVQAGGQFLSGLTSTLTPAQVGALNAQASANQAAANLTTQQTQNLAGPKPVATLAPVTGAPGNIITPPSAGIINGAPPVNVTGTVA